MDREERPVRTSLLHDARSVTGQLLLRVPRPQAGAFTSRASDPSVGEVLARLRADGIVLLDAHLGAETLATLQLKRFSTSIRRLLPTLCEGGFLRRGDNVLAFGLPGRGKTHLVCAIGYELIQRGFRVLFVPAFRLVQQLLVAKRDLKLDTLLKRLDHFDAVILDDIGYIQQDRDEMEVLFAFLAERYERKSVVVTSNLVLSQWDRIFKDPMTTACAIERLVHHSVILELTGPSFRNDAAMQRQAEAAAQATLQEVDCP
jgi:hypothetical protein